MIEANLVLTSSNMNLPAFADSPKLRLFMGTLLYLAQGFPQGIFFAAIPAWLAANGQSTVVIASAVAAASLPWSFKFLAGLFMDRYTWRSMGRRRPWLIGSQTGIVVALVIAAVLSPSASDTAIVIGIILTLSILTAMQDVALDALVVDLTPKAEMGRMNGFMFGGKVFGIAGGSAITSYLRNDRIFRASSAFDCSGSGAQGRKTAPLDKRRCCRRCNDSYSRGLGRNPCRRFSQSVPASNPPRGDPFADLRCTSEPQRYYRQSLCYSANGLEPVAIHFDARPLQHCHGSVLSDCRWLDC